MATAASTWPALIAGRKAKASEVEAKFDWAQTNLYPHNGGTPTDSAYDIGTATARWKSVSTRAINPTTTADGIAIGKATADSSACLDMSAFQKAMYLPILTTAERNALTPQAGFVIFNSTAARMERYEGGQWLAMNNPIGLSEKKYVDLGAATGYVTLLDSTSGSGRLVAVCGGGAGANIIGARITVDGVTLTSAANAATTGVMYLGLDQTLNTATSFLLKSTEQRVEISFKNSIKVELNKSNTNQTFGVAFYEIS